MGLIHLFLSENKLSPTFNYTSVAVFFPIFSGNICSSFPFFWWDTTQQQLHLLIFALIAFLFGFLCFTVVLLQVAYLCISILPQPIINYAVIFVVVQLSVLLRWINKYFFILSF